MTQDLTPAEIKTLARDGGSCKGCQWNDAHENLCILTGDCHRVVTTEGDPRDPPRFADRCTRCFLPMAAHTTEGGCPTRETAIDRALATQVGGGHYKGMAIQPFEYIHKNGIGFAEGCAIKYLSRWKLKGGVEDLRKARHFIDLLIEAEVEKQGQPSSR